MVDLKRARIAVACGTLSTGGMPRFVLTHLKYASYSVTLFEPYRTMISNIRDQIAKLPNVRRIVTVSKDRLHEVVTPADFDLVHFHDWPVDIPMPVGVPSVQTLHSTISGYVMPTDRHIFLSEVQRSVYPGVTADVLGSLVDTGVFHPGYASKACREKLRLPDGKLVVCVGLISGHKRQQWLVDNWDVDATLVCVGPMADSHREHWEPLREAASQGKRVLLVGATTHPEEYLAAADVVVSASVLEGLCLANLEASAMGKPLVIRDIPQNAAVYTHKRTAWLCGDTDFMPTLRYVLEGGADVAAVAQAGMAMVQKVYAPQVYVSKVDAIYRKLLSGTVEQPSAPPLEVQLRGVASGISVSFMNGAEVRLAHGAPERVNVSFVNTDTNEVTYATTLQRPVTATPDHQVWARSSQRSYVPWLIRVTDSASQLVIERRLDLRYRRVLVVIDSSALGDTLAWAPYAVAFARRYNAALVLMSAWSGLLAKVCDCECIGYQDVPKDIEAMYRIGLYATSEGYPTDFRHIPLQQVASNALGLQYEEQHLSLLPLLGTAPCAVPYVCIAPQSTMRAKEWALPGGWDQVVSAFTERGLRVFSLTHKGPKIAGATNISGTIEEAVNFIGYSQLLVGLSSGLSWLARGLNVPVVMIAGFTMPYTEFSTGVVRLQNTRVCHGCYADGRIPFERYWTWCPRSRNFECTRRIPVEAVMQAADMFLPQQTETS